MSIVRLVIPAGQARSGPPISTSLGPKGVNLKSFCDDFNKATSTDDFHQGGPVVVCIDIDEKTRKYEMTVLGHTTSFLILKAIGMEKGSSNPGREMAGSLTRQQLKDIAKCKLAYTNAWSEEEAMKIVAGSAKSMGISVDKMLEDE